ncbi:hypothetical protein PG996_013305 [Apiospora saccharicola]|uniref:Ras guanyl-nucleotide exchange factor RasGEF n=1 Tax=Apiospora saccharicola TaxID=335842 RepID=A0ABR1U7V9_9PEZI
MSSQASLRSLYRNLLRELPPRPGQARSMLHNRLRESFSSQASSQQAISAQTEQFLKYLQAQRQYVTLIERYNPGMGMDEEERTRLTARRVGMDLPVEYSAEDDVEGEKK